MTNETRERIKYYKEKLPHMKEKLLAAIMMLVIAASVTVTATYAWVTLSTAPEVTSIDTTVAANGSLEIALASGEGAIPEKSREGDSSAVEGFNIDNINDVNVTWGNLINLSNNGVYGLDQITLRPTALNGTTGLLRNPLHGVEYGDDGRIKARTSSEDFAYSYFDSKVGKFMADLNGEHLGVRAISTVTYENVSGNETMIALDNEIFNGSNGAEGINGTKANYEAMTTNEENLAAITGLVQAYAQSILADNLYSIDISDHVPKFYSMMLEFESEVMEPLAESYVAMINLMDLLVGDNEGDTGYTVETLINAAINGTLPQYYDKSNNSVEIATLKEFAEDYKALKAYLKTGEGTLAYYAEQAKLEKVVTWSAIEDEVKWLCSIDEAKIENVVLGEATMSDLVPIATKGMFGTVLTSTLQGGALARMEARIGECMSPRIAIKVDASSIISGANNITLKSYLRTSNYAGQDTPKNYLINDDYETVKNLYDGEGGFRGNDAVAQDTYAMAIDFWVRTNAGGTGEEITEVKKEVIDGVEVVTKTIKSAQQAYLTLEGSLKTHSELQYVQQTIKDANGNEQPLYTATIKMEDGTTTDVFVFQRYGEYYYMEEGNEIHFENKIKAEYGTLPEITYKPYTEETYVEVVDGYEGVNRVWDDTTLNVIKGDGVRSTQGKGSCYIFSAETPSDQERFLKVLEAMKVVFINGQGRQLGIATMDTENYYSEPGKVTVPLVLDKSQAYDLGDGVYGLTPLVKNAATRITALVYLDGNSLTNDMVLASQAIDGKLNIQFGSSVAVLKTTTVTEDGVITDIKEEYEAGRDSVAIEDEDVMSQFVKVTADADVTSFEFVSGETYTTNLSVTVEGVEPKTVSARFVRAVSSTQGALQPEVTLTAKEGKWSGAYTFNKAGKYVLRSVWVDGIEYELEKPIEVIVKGISVTSLTCTSLDENNRALIMTSNSSWNSEEMTLGFSSDSEKTSGINGIFTDENGRTVNVPFKKNSSGKWVGVAKFTSSGIYTMKYIEIDNSLFELDESIQPTFELLLGLKVSTKITTDEATLALLEEASAGAGATPTNFVLNYGITPTVTLDVEAEVYDNNGNEILGLANVWLFYNRSGSAFASDGLNSLMTWNAAKEVYQGKFLVNEVGNYQFSELTVGSNHITKATEAPEVRVKPAGDVEYVSEHSDPVQYAPESGGVVMKIAMANSSAAEQVKATLVNTSTGEIVKDVPGEKSDNIIGISDSDSSVITPWKFTISNTENRTLDGKWQLTEVSMTEVYYNKAYVSGDETVTFDLSEKKIYTEVVNEIRVILGVGDDLSIGDEEDEKSYFMDVPAVTDVTVAFEDKFENNINDLIKQEIIKISDINVYYDRNPESSLSTGFSTTDSLADVARVSGDVSDTYELPEDETLYCIEALNFMYAGDYDQCEVSFVLNDKDINLTNQKTTYDDYGVFKLLYEQDGKRVTSVPKYRIDWNQLPTVKITGTNPAGTTVADSRLKDPEGIAPETFYLNIASRTDYSGVPVKNYYEDYRAVLYHKTKNATSESDGSPLGGYITPQISMKLSNVGNNWNDTAEIRISYGDDKSKTNIAKFQNKEATCEVGGLRGYTRLKAGNEEIRTIDLSYGGKTFTANLSNPLNIIHDNSAPAKVTFEIPSNYSSVFKTPETITSYDKRSLTFTLPLLSETKTEERASGENTSVYCNMITTEKYTWPGGTCGSDKDGYKVITTYLKYDVGQLEEVNRTYKTTEWSITNGTNSSTYAATEKTSISAGSYVVTAKVAYTDQLTGNTREGATRDTGYIPTGKTQNTETSYIDGLDASNAKDDYFKERSTEFKYYSDSNCTTELDTRPTWADAAENALLGQ